MKRLIARFALLWLAAALACPQAAALASAEDAPLPAMTLESAGVTDGALGDAFGMHGTQKKGKVPTRSLPLTIKDAPEGTVCYALVMLDPDSRPLCGYEWVHWLAAGFAEPELAENASIDSPGDMVQGKNDFGSVGYGGPTPPDKPHTYIITVYALDALPELKSGFSQKQLAAAMEGHILAEASLSAVYRD